MQDPQLVCLFDNSAASEVLFLSGTGVNEARRVLSSRVAPSLAVPDGLRSRRRVRSTRHNTKGHEPGIEKQTGREPFRENQTNRGSVAPARRDACYKPTLFPQRTSAALASWRVACSQVTFISLLSGLRLTMGQLGRRVGSTAP